MGVPKFFRYITERYPCLSELIKEYQISEFDNLYLDMNGIVHICSHPDDSIHFRISEEQIFADIFHYTEVLFRIIKPLKVFFLAIDGVAPRAKMNQQRSRRFRTAKYVEKMEKEAKEKGEVLPSAERFDPNSITPGTEFMARLQEQLKYFIVKKISTDSLWQNCKVILSGHETPGEGEHKIMDYIRYIRAQPGYDPNTRHCLYGLDADLVMLGLCTHEPHFSLLREEVKFGKKSGNTRRSKPEMINFYLLHLSLMREYIAMEFSPVKTKLSFKFDVEKIIDDWVLMGFLVGNDFIPNLPNLNIANGALPILYNAYMKVLPTLDGYINENGALNLARFEKFMEALCDLDVNSFTEQYADIKYFEAKTGRRPNHSQRTSYKTRNLEKWEDELIDENACEPLEPEQSIKKPINSGLAALIQATEDILLEPSLSNLQELEDNTSDCADDMLETSSCEEDELFDAEFQQHKKDYYMNKLDYEQVTPEVLRTQAEGYVRAIQWNLNYYYNGCCSWGWFYPHHYAPFISDIRQFKDLKLEFDLGTPFHPFEQLLSVLPAACRNLLPKCYHQLMLDDKSIIKDYYPTEFALDLNGKKQDWEAVVLIPFIDEKLLLEAMSPCNRLLTKEEVRRNSHGPMLEYQYSNEDFGAYEAPEHFPPIKSNHAKIVEKWNEDIHVPRDQIVKGAYPGAVMDIYYPGFPTFKHLKFDSHLEKAGVKVFEQPSRGDNMIISVINTKKDIDPQSAAQEYLGKVVFVAWPHLVEALVVSVSTPNYRFTHSSEGKLIIEERRENQQHWEVEKGGIVEHYYSHLGITVGETKILLYVKLMTGRKYVFSSQGRVTLEKQWAEHTSIYPLQTIVTNIEAHTPDFKMYRNVEDVFSPGSQCFMLGLPYYGYSGTVQDSKDILAKGRLRVSLTVSPEPSFHRLKDLERNIRVNYMPVQEAAMRLGIGKTFFSQITGCVFVIMGVKNSFVVEDATSKINIGLNLKFNKRNEEVPGYTRKSKYGWLYSHTTINLVKDYMDQFPDIINKLVQKSYSDNFYEYDLFPEDKGSGEGVRKISEWLRQQPYYNMERQPCGTQTLEPAVVQEMEKLIDGYNGNKKTETVKIQVKPFLLFKPGLQTGNVVPDQKAVFQLYDRVVNIRESYTVPLGYTGTVIKIHNVTSKRPEDQIFDVVFDEPFAGGMALNCSENRGYKMPAPALINRSFGARDMESKTGTPGQLIQKFNQNQHQYNQHNQPRQPNSAFAWCNRPDRPEFGNFSNAPRGVMPNPRPPPIRSQVSGNVAGFAPRAPPCPQVPPFLPNNGDFMPAFSKSPEKTVKVLQRPNNGTANKQNHEDGVKISVEEMIAHISQRQQQQQQQMQQKPTAVLPPPPQIPPPRPLSYCLHLMSFYRMQGLGCPIYQYFYEPEARMFNAQITIPNSRESIFGGFAPTKEEASEKVAEIVYNKLTRLPMVVPEPPPQAPVLFPKPPPQWRQRPHQPEPELPSGPHGPPAHQKNKGPKAFVPLQAVKQQLRANKLNNVQEQPTKQWRDQNVNISREQQHANVNNEPKILKRDDKRAESSESKAKRERKMRLAANFSSK